ncbi:GlxA family transcriptional regulator [Marinobacterium arenosum]|uniref:GlxA family transcriptional regulator n=1 Tax=Marinobacterium arenosum TaxID=2862496 RepID=UPI001C97A94F|nr:GlxA family transcriptional regulator [Marinobacterium arenosum]MBY4678373.1 GlxA family transcriptional regulator [Marinobacterium arenosum]
MQDTLNKRHFSNRMRDTNSPFLPARPLPDKPIRVSFVLLEHFSMMAFTAAVDALVTANLVSTTPLFSISSYGLDNPQVRSDLSIDISANGELNQLHLDGDGAVDVLIVCGGFRCSLTENPLLTSKLKTAAKRRIILGGLWNGAIALAYADQLNGRRCALHPDNHAFMRETFNQVQLSNQALEIDGDRITSAGPSSALEMMLALIEQLHDSNMVRAIREILSCDKGADPSATGLVQTADDPSFPDTLRELLRLMSTNIEEPLSIDELATCVGSSRRRVERLFQTHLSTPPSRYYLELRITHARRLLLQSNESIANIAVACGFLSSTHFSHCFKDYFGVSPSQARQKHRTEQA